MKILVTGAKGMLGRDLCPVLEDEGFEVLEESSKSLNIVDLNQVEKILKEKKPEIVIHCAAYTKVDLAEEEEQNAHLINAIGTENIAKICGKLDIKLIYISTDYVFDGEKNSKYIPSDKTHPLCVYGKTKLEGEIAVTKYCKKYYIIRTSWLYGHYGKNFVETMLSLAEAQKEINVVDDQIGCPTWTVELANAIVKMIDKNEMSGIYHICCSGETSWYNFAKEIFEIEGLNVNLKPCQTKDFPRPAKRPRYSVLENNKSCRKWQAALKDYLMLR